LHSPCRSPGSLQPERCAHWHVVSRQHYHMHQLLMTAEVIPVALSPFRSNSDRAFYRAEAILAMLVAELQCLQCCLLGLFAVGHSSCIAAVEQTTWSMLLLLLCVS